MWYQLLADSVVVLHAAFIVFVVLGGLLVMRWRWVAWLHIPAAVWGAIIEFTGWICPLTPLEVTLRIAAGGRGYSESFIEHYLLPTIYPSGLTSDVQLLLGFAVAAVNLVIYTIVVMRWLGRRKETASG